MDRESVEEQEDEFYTCNDCGAKSNSDDDWYNDFYDIDGCVWCERCMERFKLV